MREFTRLRVLETLMRGNLHHSSTKAGSAAAAAMLSCLFFFPLVIRAQAPPELPKVNLESFEPELRERVRKAYADAEARPRDAEAAGRLGMILQAYEQYDLAAVCYERARRLGNEEFRWIYYFASAQAALGRNNEAAEAFKEAVRRRPDYLPAQLRLADALMAAGRASESLQFYEAVIKLNPGVAQAFYGLGRVKAAAGELPAAEKHLRKAIELFPEYGAAHFSLGLALRDMEKSDQAKDHLALSQKYKLTRPPLDDPLIGEIADLNLAGTEMLKRGVSLESAGRLDESIAEHERALKANPQLTQAHINLISLYGRTGRFQEAEKHYRAVAALNPDLADSHYNFGVLLVNQQRYAEAKEAFYRSLQLNQFHADSHHNYAVIIEREGRLDEAAAHYRRAIENKPGHRLANFHLGRILVNQNRPAEAIEHFKQTLEPRDENSPRFYYALGATYARAGDRAKAIQYLRESLKLANEFGQSQLIKSIERDLGVLEKSAEKSKTGAGKTP